MNSLTVVLNKYGFGVIRPSFRIIKDAQFDSSMIEGPTKDDEKGATMLSIAPPS